METLRGIRIFGYGTLIPMDLIPPKPHIKLKEESSQMLYESYMSTQGIMTPINHEEALDQVEELPTIFMNKNNNNTQGSLQQNDSFDIDSPTRISSTDQLNSLDKYVTQNTNDHNGNNDELFNSNGIFNSNLFDKIVEKAEFGRVVMGVQDI